MHLFRSSEYNDEEDELVLRAAGRAGQGHRLSAETGIYIFLGVALCVFFTFFAGGIWLCMKILETGMESGDWFLGF